MNAGNKVSINSIEAVAKFLRINVLDFLLSKGLSVNVEAKTANLNILNNANNALQYDNFKTDTSNNNESPTLPLKSGNNKFCPPDKFICKVPFFKTDFPKTL